jgi:hypothetical protein
MLPFDASLLAFTSVRSARSFKEEDKTKILSATISHFGSLEVVDQYIKDLMKTHMSNPWFELHE